MEQETFLSGYCRTIDQSRMVSVVTDGSALCEVDCCFETCNHRQSCEIAKAISAMITK